MKEYKPSGAITYGLEGRCIQDGLWTDWTEGTGGSVADRGVAKRKMHTLNQRADYSDIEVHARVTFSIPLDELPNVVVWAPGQESAFGYQLAEDTEVLTDARRALGRIGDLLAEANDALAALP